MNLEGKIAVVTGASSGIGRVIAQEIAREGANVFLIARREGELEITKSQIINAGGKAEAIPADMSSPESIKDLVSEISSKTEKVDLLFNVAGIGYYKSIEEITEEEWADSLAVNLSAPFFLTQGLLPQLNKSSESLVVNIGSGLGKNPIYPERIGYIASKFGLRGMSLALSRYFKGKSPKFCLVTLGSVLTNFGPGGLEGRLKKQKEGKKYYSPEWVAQKLIELIKNDKIQDEITLLPTEQLK
jgi:gluconate 5-dehydrogenase